MNFPHHDCGLSSADVMSSLCARMKILSILALLTVAVSAQEPKVFEGLFEKEVPVRASIGMVVPPPEIDKYISKVEAAARKNPEWFKEFSAASKPGTPLPYHENLGLTKEEYDDYLVLWAKREFKPTTDVMLVLRETFGDTWTLTASGEAGAIGTLRYDPKTDSFRSPNGELKRIDDIQADASSILGAWSGKEWRFEEETGLGKTKENFAIGKYDKTGFGLVVYRVQEISTEGSRLLDKSLVLRFALGKAGHLDLPKAP
ncbi:hypothetical protein ACFSSA_05570 [Luteolibacter algae]|uniref:Uncharacterized protein n=1 Tax=Luteolibacter algae TaxID=454151 RepID=A0ABW5D5K8_9BACT